MHRNALTQKVSGALFALLLLFSVANGASGQNYIITNGTYYLTHDATSGAVSTAGVSDFNPGTCLWSITGNYIRPVNADGNVLDNLYLRPRSGNNNYGLNTNTSTNYADWTDAQDGGQPYYTRYLRWSGSNSAWQISTTNSQRGTLHLVTKTTENINNAAAYNGTISGNTALTGAGATSTLTPAATHTAAYSLTTVTYSYSGGELGSTTTGTVPTPTTVSLDSGWELAWSLSDDTYATISDAGVVTVKSDLPATYATTTVTLTATRTDGTGSFTASLPITIYASADIQTNVIGGTQGVSGGTVTLNDYEDHSWSYYSDASLPARMRSLNPSNVKITYYGNGTNTVTTSADASPALDTFTASTDNSVAVGIGEPEATFVYYKTLERTSGNAYGSAAYNYTTIPNPLQHPPHLRHGRHTLARLLCLAYQERQRRHHQRQGRGRYHRCRGYCQFRPDRRVRHERRAGSPLGKSLCGGRSASIRRTRTQFHHSIKQYRQHNGRCEEQHPLHLLVLLPQRYHQRYCGCHAGKIGAIGTVFSGGNEAKVVGNTNVNIGTLMGENIVFVTPEAATEADRTKSVLGADIKGNVFGGGNNAEVKGNAKVFIGR